MGKVEKIRLPYRTGSVRVSSPYGLRELNGATGWHGGIDLVGTEKTVVAVTGGTVLQSRMVTDHSNRTWEWGNYVSVAADDGKTLYYCHLSSRKVEQGQRVEAGDVLGVEGSTGYSFGSHCHFEVRADGQVTVNAADYLGIANCAGAVYDAGDGWGERETEEPELSDGAEKDATTDSEPQAWAKEAVSWALERGILLGDGNGNLRLRSPCTREELLVFLYRCWNTERESRA